VLHPVELGIDPEMGFVRGNVGLILSQKFLKGDDSYRSKIMINLNFC
jgi:hypothetical protein